MKKNYPIYASGFIRQTLHKSKYVMVGCQIGLGKSGRDMYYGRSADRTVVRPMSGVFELLMCCISGNASFIQRLGRLIDRMRSLRRRCASTADRIPRAVHGESGKPVDRVAAVCYRYVGQSIEFKLVRTKGGRRWTFPKGHVEEGEELWRAAQREALEEVGVHGSIVSEPFIVFPHEKRGPDGRSVELMVVAYLLHVESDCDASEPGRDPTWFSPEQARQKLAERRPPQYQQVYSHVIDEACRILGRRG